MENPVLGLLAGAVFTGLVQSSAATVGIAIDMSFIDKMHRIYSLTKRIAREVLPDDNSADEEYLRTIDESGKDYLSNMYKIFEAKK
jgi:hypothetical protein